MKKILAFVFSLVLTLSMLCCCAVAEAVDITGEWYVDGSALTITEDGKLCMEEDGVKMVFGTGDGAPAPAKTAVPEAVSGDAESFFGTWEATTMEMEGSVFNVADIGIVMEFTLNADGTAIVYDGENTDNGTWSFEDGKAYIEGMAFMLMDNGSLCTEEDGAKLYFSPAEQSSTGSENVPSQTESTADMSGLEDYIGTWHACYLSTGGMTGDPRSAFGLQITLVLNEDGTGTLNFPEQESHVWYQDDESGTVFFGEGGDAPDMPLTLLENGFLCYGSMDGDGNAIGGYIMFSQDAEAVWNTGLTLENRLDRKFICTSAEIDGFTMEAAMLGGEYSLTFHADGTTDFVMVGTPISGLPWTQEIVQTDAGETIAFVVDYYGSKMEAVWTEEGFDMNYFDSMLMHFVPEE